MVASTLTQISPSFSGDRSKAAWRRVMDGRPGHRRHRRVKIAEATGEERIKLEIVRHERARAVDRSADEAYPSTRTTSET
jgi:hypothetical protein